MTRAMQISVGACALLASFGDAYAFVPSTLSRIMGPTTNSRRSATKLKMVDQQIIQGGAIAVAGLAAGIGLVAFTEAQGERARNRGAGLSDSMSTRIAGGLLEDVEVSSVDDVGSLTTQLEKALKESGGAKEEQFVMTDDDKKRLQEEADDGW